MKVISKFNVKLSYDKKKMEYHKKIEKIDQRRWRCVCVKTFTVLFCIAGFTFNSLLSFKQFLNTKLLLQLTLEKKSNCLFLLLPYVATPDSKKKSTIILNIN